MDRQDQPRVRAGRADGRPTDRPLPASGAGDGPTSRRAPGSVATDRLLLRPWCAADREAFAAMNADAEVMRFVGSGVLDAVGSDGMRARLRREWARAGHGLWALERRDGGGFAGFCGLTGVPFGTRGTAGASLEIGWRLPRDQWGHGFATEAARAALDVAWGALGATAVVALVHPDNARSLAVGERLGMRVVGTTRHPPSGWRVLVLRADRHPADGADVPPVGHATGADHRSLTGRRAEPG